MTHTARRSWMGLVVAVLCLGISSPAVSGSSNSLMDLSDDGKLLACSNRDNGTVTIVDLSTRKKLHEIPVGQVPEGVSFIGATHTLAVAVYRDDVVVFIDADSGKELARTIVFDEPYGVVSTKDGSRVYVTLDYPGQVLEIDTSSHKITRTIEAGRSTRGIALDPQHARVYITEYYTGIVRSYDRATGQKVEEWVGSEQDNLARQLIIHPTRPKAYLPHQRSRTSVAQGAGSIFPYVSIVDIDSKAETRRKRMQMDSFNGTYVVANPWEVALSPDAKRLYVVFSGTDDLFECEVLDDNYREIRHERTLELGSNPRAVKVSDDGQSLFVYNALDFNVVEYDTRTLRPVATISVCKSPLDEELLTGKKFFYSANQPMVGRRWISCSSCHPDGDSDGRVWQQPEGLRDTQAIFGLAWTHPLHWSADRDEVQDFEHTIRGPLMQGRGLARGSIHESLEKPNQGLSRDLDALAVYTNSHTFAMSPHAKSGLSEAAQRGKQHFFSKETGCAKCHSGPFYTDSQPGAERKLHDVGTGNADSSEKIGPKYDTPTLIGVYRTAPYLHHGKAKTLEEVLTTFNPENQHGTTTQLTPAQIADLVEFLKALPYEDPVEQAKKAGLIQVRGSDSRDATSSQ
jgi:YVTN family beta-propeller protein